MRTKEYLLFLVVMFVGVVCPSDISTAPSFNFVYQGYRFLHFTYPDGWRDEPVDMTMQPYLILLPDAPGYLAHAQYLVAKKMWDDLPAHHVLWDKDGIKWLPLHILIVLLRAASAGGEKEADKLLLYLHGSGFSEEPMPSAIEIAQMQADLSTTQGD